MKPKNPSLAALLAMALLGAAAPASANPEEAMTKAGCMACHAKDKKMVGPSFQQIAAQWRDKPDAEKTLVTTVRQGSLAAGGPHWGQVKMPDDSERAQISEREARRMVRWIMKQ
mgnify:CR=1 FL=1